MARMVDIEKKLSMLKEKRKHIVYLVTEDRDILQAVFEEMADTLKSFFIGCGVDKNLLKILQSCNSDSFFRCAASNGILANAYEVFPIREQDYISKEFWDREEKNAAGEKDSLKRALFFWMNDFHILRESKSGAVQSASHFLKQFLLMAECEEKENNRFLVLFLISPFLKVPEGFEHEIEIIDIPEMDQEDIEGFMLSEAKKEYAKDLHSNKQIRMQDTDLVDRRRIHEAAGDFRGISRRGLQEIIVDLQSEFGSFFGRAKDGSGTEENRRKISENRKRMIVEWKKNAALHDSTVTMLEPKNTVAGMKTFLNWIQDDVREEFLHVEKAYLSGNEPPKGVLLTGVPGSGKTQAAKAVAAIMGGTEGNVPLVQFRMDNLLGGLVGDSESNFKRCRKRIEALAPCIVLMDEIEKTFAVKDESGKNDVKMNILTALLDWMQENKKQIFFFATSNSVTDLKPELLRDGRFDMRFCVFMPTHDELVEIFCVHMKNANKRAKDTGGMLFDENKFDYAETARQFLEKITEYAEKEHKNMFYTGANIENLIMQTNRNLRKAAEAPKSKLKKPYAQSDYVDKLVETAKDKFSQPYGVTNMGDIVGFWLSAYKNQYTNASGMDLLPFSAFDREKGEFRENEIGSSLHAYDQYMSERIRAEIEKAKKAVDK